MSGVGAPLVGPISGGPRKQVSGVRCRGTFAGAHLSGGRPATGVFTSRRGPGEGSSARRGGIRHAESVIAEWLKADGLLVALRYSGVCLFDIKSRVEHTLPFMYALHQHAQHLCPRVLTLACPRLLTVADIKGHVSATRGFRIILIYLVYLQIKPFLHLL